VALTNHAAVVNVVPTHAATVNVAMVATLARRNADAAKQGQNAAAVLVLTASAAAIHAVTIIHSVARMIWETTSVEISLVTALMFSPESSEAVK